MPDHVPGSRSCSTRRVRAPPLQRHVVEGVKSHRLVHQHSFMIGVPEHNDVNECYVHENMGREAGSLVSFGGEAVDGAFDLCFGFGETDEVGRIDEFAGPRSLVVHEEVLDGVEFVGGYVADVLDVVPAVVAGRNAEHLVVAALSSTILNMPTGRASTMTPGNTGSGSSTMASSGSPSRRGCLR